jgi:hypothetical protein
MINQEELAICKRRGHKISLPTAPNGKWSPCDYCGVWLREVRTIEERGDEPPAEEQSSFVGLRKR